MLIHVIEMTGIHGFELIELLDEHVIFLIDIQRNFIDHYEIIMQIMVYECCVQVLS